MQRTFRYSLQNVKWTYDRGDGGKSSFIIEVFALKTTCWISWLNIKERLSHGDANEKKKCKNEPI